MAATLNAKEREDLRHSATRQLRNNGSIPAIVYGKETAPFPVSIDSLELLKMIRDNGRNAVYTLQVEGGETVDVMLYDYQSDPLKNEVTHVDFYQVDMTSDVEVEVPIKLNGQEAIKDGVIQQTLHEIGVRARPNDIPEFLNIDISDLKIGDSLSIGDLIKVDSHGFEMLGDEMTVIVTVLPPQNAGEPEQAQQEADAEAEKEENVAKEEDQKEE